MKEPLVSRILKYALCAAFIAILAGAATLPFMYDRYASVLYDAYYNQPGYRAFIIIFLIFASAPCLWITLEMIFMLRSIPKNPFAAGNVRSLNRIGALFFILAAAFFIKCALYITILTLLCGFLFVGGGLFAFTLAALICQSAAYKDENDLTI